jgi:site-specific DNA-methyltransferase (adenine-specific)
MSVSSNLNWVFNYDFQNIGNSLILHADCFEWLGKLPENSVHGIVTDPPYGVKEYDFDQLQKMENGNGGIWRIPPSFDGNERSPLPRFTALSESEREQIDRYFTEWAKLVSRVLRPGGHMFVASNAYLSQLVFSSIARGGLEFRGEIIRLVRTLRGGDRPKNAEEEFDGVCSLPRGCYEPWGVFRNPIPANMRISDCLNEYQTGGIRRKPDGNPFEDVINSTRTPKKERDIAPHPTLKPQDFLRQLVYAVLPLGEGVVIDPYMGSGSTIAAAESLGIPSIGVERYVDYFEMAQTSIPKLASLTTKMMQPNLF